MHKTRLLTMLNEQPTQDGGFFFSILLEVVPITDQCVTEKDPAVHAGPLPLPVTKSDN